MDGDELIDRGPEEERLPWWWPLSTYPGDEEARQIVRKASTFATVTA